MIRPTQGDRSRLCPACCTLPISTSCVCMMRGFENRRRDTYVLVMLVYMMLKREISRGGKRIKTKGQEDSRVICHPGCLCCAIIFCSWLVDACTALACDCGVMTRNPACLLPVRVAERDGTTATTAAAHSSCSSSTSAAAAAVAVKYRNKVPNGKEPKGYPGNNTFCVSYSVPVLFCQCLVYTTYW